MLNASSYHIQELEVFNMVRFLLHPAVIDNVFILIVYVGNEFLLCMRVSDDFPKSLAAIVWA